MKQIHVHDIQDYLLEAAKPVSHSQVLGHFQSFHPNNARYYSCKRQGMSLEEAVDFLVSKSKVKFIPGQGLLCTPSTACNHSH